MQRPWPAFAGNSALGFATPSFLSASRMAAGGCLGAGLHRDCDLAVAENLHRHARVRRGLPAMIRMSYANRAGGECGSVDNNDVQRIPAIARAGKEWPLVQKRSQWQKR